MSFAESQRSHFSSYLEHLRLYHKRNTDRLAALTSIFLTLYPRMEYVPVNERRFNAAPRKDKHLRMVSSVSCDTSASYLNPENWIAKKVVRPFEQHTNRHRLGMDDTNLSATYGV